MSDNRIDIDISDKMRAAIEHYYKNNFLKSEELCKEILSIKPQVVDALYLLGVLYDLNGQKEQAIQQLSLAITCNPNRHDIHIKRGDILSAIGRYDVAVASYERATKLDPSNIAAHINLGNAFQQLGKYSNAVECFNQALILSPENPAIYFNLGNALKALYRFDDAVTSYKRALSIQPDFVKALVNLGSLYQEYGFVEEAIELNQRVLALRPDDAVAESNYLLALDYLQQYKPEIIYTEHLKYGSRYKHLMRPRNSSCWKNKSLDRRLRIGYVSPDLRSHPMASFIEPVIANHDRNRVAVICYFNHYLRDGVTERLSQLADEWHDIVHMSDGDVACRILKDKVDILVDLAGHTAMNRLLVFARKPAPVQVTWLGYMNTTGLLTMDYRITDENASPAGDFDSRHTESLARMPDSQWCYQQPEESPDVNKLPAIITGHITFASFHNLAKVTPDVIELWSDVINAVHESRLLIVARGADQRREYLYSEFTKNKVKMERIVLREAVSFHDYLMLHQQVDVNLDTHPYCGGTTTCHSLWMGVPVITLAGSTATSRGGASILRAVGLGELIAESKEQYINIACHLVDNTPALGKLRLELRQRMKDSALMNASKFCDNLEQIYKEMWDKWVSGNN